FNFIYNNTATLNTDEGIYLYDNNDNNIIFNNTVKWNRDHGIILQWGSGSNKIYYNSLIENDIQSYDSGTNEWYDKDVGGNYWSDWTAPDVNQDGIVDNPYEIGGSSSARDYFPFVSESKERRPPVEPPDTTPPEVVTTEPEDNDKNIPVDLREISITFSEPMNRTSVENSIVISPHVPHTYRWNNNDNRLSLDLAEDLAYETRYTLRINRTAEDVAGNELGSTFKIAFTTRSSGQGEDEEEGERGPGAFFTNIGVLGIVFIVILLLILLIVIIVVVQNRRKKRVKMYDDTSRIDERLDLGEGFTEEYFVDKDFSDGFSDLMKDLKRKALSEKKPSDFGLSRQEIYEQFKRKYESGEITKETLSSISEILQVKKS
ncbi:MAG: Ig-like domain-containing protein, partial [Thermoplasmata archaeon]